MYYEYDYRSKYARIFPKRAKRFSLFCIQGIRNDLKVMILRTKGRRENEGT